jgi:hypothetical protein
MCIQLFGASVVRQLHLSMAAYHTPAPSLVRLLIPVVVFTTLVGCQSRGAYFVPAATGDSLDSTIYFYRPYSGSINSPSYEITESGAHVGTLRDGGYFVLGASPGVHHYAVRQRPNGVSLYAEPGKRYFVRLNGAKKREDSGLATKNVFLELELEEEQDAVRELRKYQPNALGEP